MNFITQAYSIKVCDNCDCETPCPPNRIARLSDKFSLQLPIANFKSQNLIVNGTFGTGDLTGWSQFDLGYTHPWTYSGGKAVQTVTGTDLGDIIFQDVGIDICNGDRLKLDYSGTVKLHIYLSADGTTWTDYGYYTAGTSIDILFSGLAGTFNYIGFGYEAAITNGYIDNIEFYTQRIVLDVIDCCTDAVVKSYESCNEDPEIRIYDNCIDFGFVWSDAVSVNGQYRICFDVMENPDPCFLLSSQSGGGKFWLILNCTAVLDFGYPGDIYSKQLIMPIPLPKCSFNLNFHADLSGGTGGPVTLRIYGDDVILDEIIITAGSNNYSITLNPEYDITNLIFYAYFANPADSGILVISDVYILNTYCTDCISVEEAKCSLLFAATNLSDAFGLYSTYDGNMRVFANMYKLKPIHTEKVYRNVAGTYTNVFTDIAEKYELEVYENPKDVIFGLLLLLSFDNLKIDKKEFVKAEGTIEIDWDDRNAIGKFKTELFVKNQLREKTFT